MLFSSSDGGVLLMPNKIQSAQSESIIKIILEGSLNVLIISPEPSKVSPVTVT